MPYVENIKSASQQGTTMMQSCCRLAQVGSGDYAPACDRQVPSLCCFFSSWRQGLEELRNWWQRVWAWVVCVYMLHMYIYIYIHTHIFMCTNIFLYLFIFSDIPNKAFLFGYFSVQILFIDFPFVGDYLHWTVVVSFGLWHDFNKNGTAKLFRVPAWKGPESALDSHDLPSVVPLTVISPLKQNNQFQSEVSKKPSCMI